MGFLAMSFRGNELNALYINHDMSSRGAVQAGKRHDNMTALQCSTHVPVAPSLSKPKTEKPWTPSCAAASHFPLESLPILYMHSLLITQKKLRHHSEYVANLFSFMFGWTGNDSLTPSKPNKLTHSLTVLSCRISNERSLRKISSVEEEGFGLMFCEGWRGVLYV